jgi:hypothetical protein
MATPALSQDRHAITRHLQAPAGLFAVSAELGVPKADAEAAAAAAAEAKAATVAAAGVAELEAMEADAADVARAAFMAGRVVSPAPAPAIAGSAPAGSSPEDGEW